MFNSSSSPTYLNYQSTYNCPVCRHGQIAGMAMMDAFGCDFCNSIFTANLEQQVLKKVDSQPSLMWYWDGKNWRGGHSSELELGWGYPIAAIAFILLPPTIVGLAAYLLPPLPGSYLSWLPWLWTILTFFMHLACVIWLVMEYYQFPIMAYLRALQRRFWSVAR